MLSEFSIWNKEAAYYGSHNILQAVNRKSVDYSTF